MKKSIAILLALALALPLSACGQQGAGASGDKGDRPADGPGQSVQADRQLAEGEMAINEVIFDQEEVRVTLLSYRTDEQGDHCLRLLCENGSGQEVRLHLDSLAVNGLMRTASLYCKVDAGQQAEADCVIDNEFLLIAGIEPLQVIDFVITVAFEDTHYARTQIVSVTTGDGQPYDQAAHGRGEEFYNGNGLRVVFQGWDPDEQDTYAVKPLLLFIENNTDKAIVLYATDASVNGANADFWLGISLLPGTVCHAMMLVVDVDLNQPEGVEVSQVQMRFEACDLFSGDRLFLTEPLTLSFD